MDFSSPGFSAGDDAKDVTKANLSASLPAILLVFVQFQFIFQGVDLKEVKHPDFEKLLFQPL